VPKGTFIALLAIVGCVCLRVSASPPATSPIRAQALTAVQQAEQAVEAAAARRALWTTARDALRDAHAALERGEFGAAERLAHYATEQAELGIKQLDYRHFSLPKDSK
jgi:hypothetical protein